MPCMSQDDINGVMSSICQNGTNAKEANRECNGYCQPVLLPPIVAKNIDEKCMTGEDAISS